jgi:hypothetical protein
MVSSFGEPFSKAKRNQKRNARTVFPVQRHFQRENTQDQRRRSRPLHPLVIQGDNSERSQQCKGKSAVVAVVGRR